MYQGYPTKSQHTLFFSITGSAATRREATVLSLVTRRRNSNGRALEEDFVDDAQESIGAQPVVTGGDVRVRVKLCLASDHSVCGDTTEAECKYNCNPLQVPENG